MDGIREIVASSYFHLLALFVLAVFALKINWLSSLELNFVWFAILLGLFGIALTPVMRKVRVPHWLLYVALVLALLVRILPYI